MKRELLLEFPPPRPLRLLRQYTEVHDVPRSVWEEIYNMPIRWEDPWHFEHCILKVFMPRVSICGELEMWNEDFAPAYGMYVDDKKLTLKFIPSIMQDLGAMRLNALQETACMMVEFVQMELERKGL